MKTTTPTPSVTAGKQETTWDNTALVRLIAVSAVTATTVYLAWRATSTGSGVPGWYFYPLLMAEFVGLVRLVLEARVGWTVPARTRPEITGVISTDIVVTTFHEPEHVVRATLLGCRAVAHRHGTILVDDAGRPEMKALALEFGVTYLHRGTDAGARAGALNHALALSQAELIFVLDADQVPLPDALHVTVGYFSDPEVAIVQTPLEYLNRDSVLHSRNDRHERSVDNEVYGPARDHLGATVWNGSASVVRRSAMKSVGAVALDTTTGDLQTSVRLHAAGWETRYHGETVVQGLAPHNLALYLSQRARWARGHVGILRTRDNPFITSGLTVRQRLSYAHLLFGYLQPVADITMFAVLAASLWTGQRLFTASFTALAVFFIPALALKSVAWVALSRGRLSFRESSARRMLNLEIHLKALFAGLLGRDRRFRPIRRTGIDEGGLDVIEQLQFLTFLTLVLEAVLGLRVLDALLGGPLESMRGLALVATCTAAAASLWLSLQVLGVFVRRRQFRSHYRVGVSIGGYANGALVKLQNLTPAGVGFVSTTRIQPGSTVIVHMRLPDASGGYTDLELRAIARNLLPNQFGTRFRIGCRFVGLSLDQLNLITEYSSVVRPYQLLRG